MPPVTEAAFDVLLWTTLAKLRWKEKENFLSALPNHTVYTCLVSTKHNNLKNGLKNDFIPLSIYIFTAVQTVL